MRSILKKIPDHNTAQTTSNAMPALYGSILGRYDGNGIMHKNRITEINKVCSIHMEK